LFNFMFLVILAYRSLLFFEPILFICSKFHITLFQGALVGPPSGIGRRDDILELSWEIVKLKHKMRHPVH
jgi:hypothetical protein